MTPGSLVKTALQPVRSAGRKLFFNQLVERIRTNGPMSDPRAIFNYAARGNFGLISPIQSRAELVPALNVIQKDQPKVTMELGTCNGGTLFILARGSAPDALILSLDLP